MPTPTLRDVHVEQPLSNISIAYTNGEYIADQIFPRVSVQKRSDLYWSFPKDVWFRNEVGTRAPGTRAPRIDYTVTTASYLCLTYALAKGIPDEVRKNADAPLRPDVEATELLTDKLLLAQEVRVANLTTNGSSYWGYAASPAAQWTSDTSTPISDVDTAITNIIKAIGRRPNTMVFSWDVWVALKNHPDLLERIKYTRPGAMVTPADFGNWVGIDKILIGTALVNTGNEGSASSFVSSFIWGDQVWLGFVTPGPALLTPSAGYVLEWQSRQVKRFREDQEHQDVIEVSHSTAEVVTASDAGGVIYNAV